MNKKIIIACTVGLLFFTGCKSSASTQATQTQGQTQKQTQNGNSEEQGTGKEITIEDLVYTDKQDTYTNYDLKVRNNTDKKIGHIDIDYQVLDANGDSLKNDQWMVNDLQPGQAVMAYAQLNDQNLDYKNAVSIVFRSYTLSDVTGNQSSDYLYADFPEPVTFNLSEVKSE